MGKFCHFVSTGKVLIGALIELKMSDPFFLALFTPSIKLQPQTPNWALYVEGAKITENSNHEKGQLWTASEA